MNAETTPRVHASVSRIPVAALALLLLLLCLRLPSLVQPAGADQALYGYVGTRVLAGELPYRDAWDQKPPAIHFTYAVLVGLWRHDSVVALADLVVAGAVAALLVALGRRAAGSTAAGVTAAALFLLLGDPTFNRLSGVRIRAQCETFIALAVTAAILSALRSRPPASETDAGYSPRWAVLAGVLAGLAFTFKYNTLTYVPVALMAIAMSRPRPQTLMKAGAAMALGAMLPVAALLLLFALGGALDDLYYATIKYNLEYSGETYAGAGSFVRYLLTFPIGHARVDALWTLGGLGCMILIAAWVTDRRRIDVLLPVAWVAAACLSIAINGSRGLPQYFVQAAPGLAMAAGWAAALLWPAGLVAQRYRTPLRVAVVLLVAYGAWRVNEFDKIPRNAAHDLAFITGRLSREDHLARYGGQPDAKYAALSVHRLAGYLEQRTSPSDFIYIFGFSPGAYVNSGRVSASRFFWSRPVLVGFNDGVPGYGADGVLAELQQRPPRYVVLQIHDWAPPPNDSVTFFTQSPLLGPWLRAHYRQVEVFEDYEIWVRAEGS